MVLSTMAAEQSKPETDDMKEWSLSAEACKRTMLEADADRADLGAARP